MQYLGMFRIIICFFIISFCMSCKKKKGLQIQKTEQISSGVDTAKEFYKNGDLKTLITGIQIDTIEVEDASSGDIYIQVVRSKNVMDFYPDGNNKKYSEVYRGDKSGKWIYWDKSGTKIREEYYQKDSLINVIEF